MKLKRLFLLLPMLMSISACSNGEKSYAGTYSFQLGSDTGTHAGIHLTLTDELVPNMETPAKKFSIEFDVKGQGEDDEKGAGILSSLRYIDDILKALDNTSLVDINDLESYFDSVVNAAEDIVPGEGEDEPIKINGYYSVNKLDGQTNLDMGIMLNEYGFNISDEIVKKIMYATISEDTVTVVIPVSIRDFLFQLYWYGYRIAGLSSLLEPVYLPEENPFMHENPIGSHPTADEVKEIQKYQEKRNETKPEGYETGEFIYINYYNYHTLSMGLIKDGKK